MAAKTADTATVAVDPRDAEIAELKAQLGQFVPPVPPRDVDYVWPVATPEQQRRSVAGGDAPTRVVKVTYTDKNSQFWYNGQDLDKRKPGVKTVHIGQWRYPMADSKWDQDRLFLEMKHNNLVLIEEAFPEAKHYCELNNCWNYADGPNGDGNFCDPRHRRAALTGHDRMIKFD